MGQPPKTTFMKRNWRPSASILFGSALLLIFGALAIPKLRIMKTEANQSKAISNLSSLGIAMTEFDSQYGGFPSIESRELLIEEGIELPEGDTANAYLAQLLASKTLDSEKVFYIPGLKGTKEGDDIFDSPETTLARGENSFGYAILSDGRSLSQSYGSSAIPVLVAPVLKGGVSPVFDQNLFRGQAIYLKLDSSVGTREINKKGELVSKQTDQDIFKNGDNTIWGDDTPIVKAPWFLK